jgi:antitoxin (DNA-binding transcriptional repressor) of toxin-antitoxin stability system
MATVTIDEAQDHLRKIVAGLQMGEELVLTDNGQPLAKLVRITQPTPARKPRRFGTLKGSILYLAPDFDAIPEGFEDYLP